MWWRIAGGFVWGGREAGSGPFPKEIAHREPYGFYQTPAWGKRGTSVKRKEVPEMYPFCSGMYSPSGGRRQPHLILCLGRHTPCCWWAAAFTRPSVSRSPPTTPIVAFSEPAQGVEYGCSASLCNWSCASLNHVWAILFPKSFKNAFPLQSLRWC